MCDVVFSSSLDLEPGTEVTLRLVDENKEIAAIQADLIRCNGIYISHVKSCNKVNRRINSVRSVKRVNRS